ncbi:hypothetical protein [Fontibacter flavus]|uniref:LPXTG-motif cell wall anchor domain-containing protein n=1 Tax=Fontibacter flavus TaxID=654838 RepID=A0ABV6FMN7_9BACT
MKTLGIILIIAGIAMFFIPGVSFQTEKNVVDLGPIEVNKKENHNLNWPNYAGGIAIAGGLALLIAGRKK